MGQISKNNQNMDQYVKISQIHNDLATIFKVQDQINLEINCQTAPYIAGGSKIDWQTHLPDN
jgi:hypothetical protein